jgi:hypothetical protein
MPTLFWRWALVGSGGAKTTSDIPSEFAPPQIEPCCSQDSGHGPLNIGWMGACGSEVLEKDTGKPF